MNLFVSGLWVDPDEVSRFDVSISLGILRYFVSGASYNGFLRRIFVTLSFFSCPVPAHTDCFVAELKKLLD